jgi:hypothetical protein
MAAPEPLDSISYQHDGLPDFLLGVMKPMEMGQFLYDVWKLPADRSCGENMACCKMKSERSLPATFSSGLPMLSAAFSGATHAQRYR